MEISCSLHRKSVKKAQFFSNTTYGFRKLAHNIEFIQSMQNAGAIYRRDDDGDGEATVSEAESEQDFVADPFLTHSDSQVKFLPYRHRIALSRICRTTVSMSGQCLQSNVNECQRQRRPTAHVGSIAGEQAMLYRVSCLCSQCKEMYTNHQ
jgi:hypothetical protein